MKTAARIATAFVLFACIRPLYCATPAEQLRGEWSAMFSGEAHTFEVIFNFEVKDDVITGTVQIGGRDDQFKITNGKLSGNNVSFIAIGAWSGTLEGNELKLTRELDGGKKQHMVAHKTGASTTPERIRLGKS